MQIAEQLSLKASLSFAYVAPVKFSPSQMAQARLETKHYQRLSIDMDRWLRWWG